MRVKISGKVILSKSGKNDFLIKYIISAYYEPGKVLAGSNMTDDKIERGGKRPSKS